MSLTKGRLIGFGVLLLLVGMALATGLNRYIPYHDARVSRLHAAANELLDSQGDRVEVGLGNNPDSNAIRHTARQLRAVQVEAAANHDAINGQLKSCPANQQRSDKAFSMDITECAAGQFIWLVLHNPWQEQVYSVRLYKYGQNGQKVPVYAVADIQLVRDDGHSMAQKTSELYPVQEGGKVVAVAVDFKLRGDVKIVPQGSADYAEFVRK